MRLAESRFVYAPLETILNAAYIVVIKRFKFSRIFHFLPVVICFLFLFRSNGTTTIPFGQKFTASAGELSPFSISCILRANLWALPLSL